MADERPKILVEMHDWLLEQWLEFAGLPRDVFESWLRYGAPESVASKLARESGGRVKSWPRVDASGSLSFAPIGRVGRGALPRPIAAGTDQVVNRTVHTNGNAARAQAQARRMRDDELLPFQQALYKRQMSVRDWVDSANDKHNPKSLFSLTGIVVNIETARSWCKTKGSRRIPRVIADYIEKQFVDKAGRPEVPATPQSWPNGIREPQ